MYSAFISYPSPSFLLSLLLSSSPLHYSLIHLSESLFVLCNKTISKTSNKAQTRTHLQREDQQWNQLHNQQIACYKRKKRNKVKKKHLSLSHLSFRFSVLLRLSLLSSLSSLLYPLPCFSPLFSLLLILEMLRTAHIHVTLRLVRFVCDLTNVGPVKEKKNRRIFSLGFSSLASALPVSYASFSLLFALLLIFSPLSSPLLPTLSSFSHLFSFPLFSAPVSLSPSLTHFLSPLLDHSRVSIQ